MASEHIVKSYDDELKKLSVIITRMGGLTEAQLTSALDAMRNRDTDLATRTIDADHKIDELEREVDGFVVRMLALRQPMASDLREIVVALKIASDLERIADYATNVAKRTIALTQTSPVRPAHAVPRMGRLAQAMIKDVLDAYNDRDTAKAMAVWQRDEELDEMYTSLFRELLTYMMEDPRSISRVMNILWALRALERIGDHARNIAEHVIYLVHGTDVRHMPFKELEEQIEKKNGNKK